MRRFVLILTVIIASIVSVVKSTPTNGIEVDSLTSTLTGAISKYVQDQGFILKNVSIFQNTAGTGPLTAKNPGIKLTFESCSGVQQVLLYGSDSLDGANGVIEFF